MKKWKEKATCRFFAKKFEKMMKNLPKFHFFCHNCSNWAYFYQRGL